MAGDVANFVPASQLTHPITVPAIDDQPRVSVRVEWSDGATTDVRGTVTGWCPTGVMVELANGLGSWFPPDVVTRL